MDKLINELKNEHEIIISHLKSAKNDCDISPDMARQKVLSFKEMLLNHLKKEDETFYPFLYREAEKNPQLRSHLDIFSRNMEKVTDLVTGFFDKHKNQISSDFTNDLTEIITFLTRRIKAEERVLYNEYEEIKHNIYF